MALAFVLVSPLLALGLAFFAACWLKRKTIGPRKEWSRWFAWYPVRVPKDGDYWPDSETRWLEMVERKSWSALSDTYFRKAGSDWERPKWW